MLAQTVGKYTKKRNEEAYKRMTEEERRAFVLKSQADYLAKEHYRLYGHKQRWRYRVGRAVGRAVRAARRLVGY
jgi:hypothetical protein